MREAVKNCSKALEGIVGRFMYYGGQIYSMTGQAGEEPFEIASSANAQVVILKFKCVKTFSLDNMSEDQRPFMAQMLNFLNVLVKGALLAHDYK